MANLFRKTRKGVSEIETRANRLAPRLRAALILVDGRRSDQDLQKLILPDAAGALATLVEQGYIEAVTSRPVAPAASTAGTATTAAPPSPSRPRADAAAKPPSLPEVRQLAVRRLLDLLGPMAEGMAMRVEKLDSWNELLPVLNVACAMVRDMRGTAAAVEFAERFVTPYESRV